uniref:Uncharacterized protein n=1 Tax=Amphimedon queenslandica TaxID=400682 RepID=A0A1X7UBC9_AMPQE
MDKLVEIMDRILHAMIAKYSSLQRENWDEYLPKLSFAYCTMYHESTKELRFFLLYGRDALIPGDETLSHRRHIGMVDVDDYKSELMISLAKAWDITWSSISKVQKAQKKQHDKEVRVKAI